MMTALRLLAFPSEDHPMTASQDFDVRHLPMAAIRPDPEQPRRIFGKDEIEELAASIRENGLLQPIVVRRDPQNAEGYVIVAGERRYRAHLHNQAQTIPARVVELDSRADVDVAQLIENDQRVNVTYLERARAYKRTLERTGWSEAELAKRLGLKQPWRVGQLLTMLNVIPEYQSLCENGNLTEGQILEMGKLSPRGQRVLFDAIKRGLCPTGKALRAMAASLVETEAQGSMFAPAAPITADDRRRAKSLADKINLACSVLAAGFDDGELVAVRKINPGDAIAYAEKLALIQKHLAQMENALRASAVQADLLAAA